MNKNLFCDSCDLEFKVRHEADDEIYVPHYCPFCGGSIDGNEEYDVEDDES